TQLGIGLALADDGFRQVDADGKRVERLKQFRCDVVERLIQRVGGGGGGRHVEEEGHFTGAAARLFEQARVVDGDRNLRGEGRQDRDVVLIKGVGLVRLDVER